MDFEELVDQVVGEFVDEEKRRRVHVREKRRRAWRMGLPLVEGKRILHNH